MVAIEKSAKDLRDSKIIKFIANSICEFFKFSYKALFFRVGRFRFSDPKTYTISSRVAEDAKIILG